MKLIKIEEPTKIEGQKKIDEHSLPLHGTNLHISISSKDFVKNNKNETQEIKDIENRSFKKYSLSEIGKKFLHKDNIWAIYKFGESDWNLLLNARQRYEGFVCGYLEYYDSEVRNGMSDHEVFFHWGKWEGQADNCVVIFLDPAPKTKSLNISKSADRIGNKYYGAIEEVEPPNTKASDPPKVPPPPPPY
jgi:hypothetical protein